MKCRVCGKDVLLLETVHNVRHDDGKKLVRESTWGCALTDMDIYKCPECKHMQGEYMLVDSFYEQYDDGAGAQQYYGALSTRNEKIEKLASFVNQNEKSSILEIGCGAGHDLIEAEKYFDVCNGVDPSITECKLAIEKGLLVQYAYFDESYRVNDKYSAFMCFQVLEHIENVMAFLRKAYDVLIDDGVGLINVPDGQTIFERGLFHQVITEHINYYSVTSLCRAVTEAGFDIICIDRNDDSIELDIFVKKSIKMISMDGVKDRISSEMNTVLSNYDRIGVYGAGAKSYIYNSLLEDQNKVAYIFDTDTGKTARFIANSVVPISVPSNNNVNDVEAIIIFASSYNSEIMEKLREEYSFLGDILFFRNDMHIGINRIGDQL